MPIKPQASPMRKYKRSGMMISAAGACAARAEFEREPLGINSFGAPKNLCPVILVNPRESVKLGGSIRFFKSGAVRYTKPLPGPAGSSLRWGKGFSMSCRAEGDEDSPVHEMKETLNSAKADHWN